MHRSDGADVMRVLGRVVGGMWLPTESRHINLLKLHAATTGLDCPFRSYRPSRRLVRDPPLPTTGKSGWDSSLGVRKGV